MATPKQPLTVGDRAKVVGNADKEHCFLIGAMGQVIHNTGREDSRYLLVRIGEVEQLVRRTDLIKLRSYPLRFEVENG